MKKIAIVLFLMLLPSIAFANPEIKIYGRGDEMVRWEEIYFMTDGEDLLTEKRADNISFVLNDTFQFRLTISWPYKSDLGKNIKTYYFDSLEKVHVFLEYFQHGWWTGSPFSD